jgi:hypothetical protein
MGKGFFADVGGSFGPDPTSAIAKTPQSNMTAPTHPMTMKIHFVLRLGALTAAAPTTGAAVLDVLDITISFLLYTSKGLITLNNHSPSFACIEKTEAHTGITGHVFFLILIGQCSGRPNHGRRRDKRWHSAIHGEA